VFVELMPLLAGRTVMITVARENEKTLRLHIIPKKVKEDENSALSTPLSYTGTPEELDRELGKHLASYVECHTQLGSTLAQARAEMEAAAPAPSDPVAAPPAATMTLFGGLQPGATAPSAATATVTAAREGGGGESTCKLAL
jgi:PRTRC genetic system protein E